MEKIIEIKGLGFKYNNKIAIENIDLTVYKNDFLGIIGPNGGGKTTLIKSILGLLPIKKGKITFYKESKQIKKLKIGYLPQYNNIDRKFPISVKETILSGLFSEKRLFKPFTAQQKKNVEDTIKKIDIERISNKNIGELSGGELQRVLLARAIVTQPDLLILDEPNTYIDKKFEKQLYKLLSEINKECAIILISHDIGTVLQNVKSIACINKNLTYHPDKYVSEEWLVNNLHCPIDLIGHGNLPHRILSKHKKEEN